MPDYRHAGIHFPNMAEHPSLDFIAALPGVRDGACLMLASEARYHWQALKDAAPGCLLVWRGLPRVGKLPAQLGWDTEKVADEILNLWSEQPHSGVEWFQPLNELNFSKEAGEDFRGYGYMAARLAVLRVELTARFAALGQDVKLLFPPWVPSDDGDHLDDWRDEAARWSGICLHTYGDAETMRSRYQSYRDAFPGMPIFVGEHNANHTGADERASLQMWADTASADLLFLGAAYYIWETNNDGEQDFSIWGSASRLDLFQHPPVATTNEQPSPVPDPILPPADPAPPAQEDQTVPDLPRGCDVSNNNGHIDWDAVAASGISFGIAKLSEGTNFVDRFFRQNWADMKRLGLARGAYHFGRPSVNGAAAEAEFFLATLAAQGGELEPGDILALDLEDPNAAGDLSAWVFEFLVTVNARAGFNALVYSSPAFITEHNLAAQPAIGAVGLWLASWGVPTPPAAPAPWSLVAIHQTGVGGVGSVPGVAGECDLDTFNGPDVATLRLYGKPGATPAPAPAPVVEFDVGSGLQAALAAHADQAACDEIFAGTGKAGFSECLGRSGRRYVWVPSLGRVVVYEPAA